MALSVKDVSTLSQYASGVMTRADHHAPNVNAVALAVLGGVIWRADQDSVEVKQYAGELANVLWFDVNGGKRRVALAYNHKSGEIEARDRSVQGKTLRSFTNATAVKDVEQFFRCL